MAQQWGGFRQSGTQGQHDYCFLCLEFKAEFQYCGVGSEITQITFYRVDFLSDIFGKATYYGYASNRMGARPIALLVVTGRQEVIVNLLFQNVGHVFVLHCFCLQQLMGG